MPSAADIKRALRDAGFEIYRTHDNVIHVADRVRENLIMDSGVRVDCATLSVSFYARAEQSTFPGDTADELFARAAALGQPALEVGYRERRRFVTEMTDPGDASRTLDHWYQIQLEIDVADLDGAIDQVRFSFAVDKLAEH
jgi:hypothetical protein